MTHLQSSINANPMQSLEAIFMADLTFVANSPKNPRKMVSTISHTKGSVLKAMIEAFIRRYERRLADVIEEAQQCGEVPAALSKEAAARLFIAAIQHLVFRALIAGEIDKIREAAPAAFTSYRRCVEAVR